MERTTDDTTDGHVPLDVNAAAQEASLSATARGRELGAIEAGLVCVGMIAADQEHGVTAAVPEDAAAQSVETAAALGQGVTAGTEGTDLVQDGVGIVARARHENVPDPVAGELIVTTRAIEIDEAAQDPAALSPLQRKNLKSASWKKSRSARRKQKRTLLPKKMLEKRDYRFLEWMINDLVS